MIGPPPLGLAVLVSGQGSNLRALHGAITEGRCRAQILAVVSDRPSAKALEFAREQGIATAVVEPRAFADRAAWDAALARALAAFTPGLVVCAGFMRVLGAPTIERFAHRIVNVHPALLPSFPGAHGARDAIRAGVRVSGCTVHLVDAGVDTGPILAQGAVPVLPTDDEHALQARIQRVEHRLLPAIVDAIARGLLTPGASPSFAPELPFALEAALLSPSLDG